MHKKKDLNYFTGNTLITEQMDECYINPVDYQWSLGLQHHHTKKAKGTD